MMSEVLSVAALSIKIFFDVTLPRRILEKISESLLRRRCALEHASEASPLFLCPIKS